MDYVMAFIVGGAICAVGQLMMDLTKLTPAHVLVLFVSAGAILGGAGIYEKIAAVGGAGASIPLTGFGNLLAQGAIEAVDKSGFLGIFSGSLAAASGGVAAAIIFSVFASLVFNPKG
jgi:stage V sporulation protein AE